MANPTLQDQIETRRDAASSAVRDVADQASDAMSGLTESIRKNPMTCLMIGLGLGFVLARMFKR